MQTEKLPYEQRIGYACINMTLAQQKIMTNRHAVQRTFQTKGLPHISKLCLANVKDLLKIVHWNNAKGFKFYRISSGLFPWMTEYKFEDLPDWAEIRSILAEIGKVARENNQRLEFHPSHFTILASPNQVTVDRSIRDLEQHSRIFDEMGFEPSHWTPLNIHVGAAFGDKVKATQRWCENFRKLSKNCQARLVVENDDKANMYSVRELHEYIYKETGVPITFDIFHHTFCTGGLSASEAANLASQTWKDAPIVIHWSSSMKKYERPEVKEVAHADYIYDELQDWGTGGYFMCESKAKELSVLEYWEKGARPKIEKQKS